MVSCTIKVYNQLVLQKKTFVKRIRWPGWGNSHFPLTVAGLHTAQKTCESVLVPFTTAVCECLASFAGGIVEVALK